MIKKITLDALDQAPEHYIEDKIVKISVENYKITFKIAIYNNLIFNLNLLQYNYKGIIIIYLNIVFTRLMQIYER